MDEPPGTLAAIACVDRDFFIRCCRGSCGHQVRLRPEDAIAKLGPACTLAQAKARLVCTACGGRGREGFIDFSQDTVPRNYYEQEHRPPYEPPPSFYER